MTKTLPLKKVKYNIECNRDQECNTSITMEAGMRRHFTHSTIEGAAWVEWRSKGWAAGALNVEGNGKVCLLHQQ